MPGGTIITNTGQSDPEDFKSSLDWNQAIPLEDKVNDHQIKSRAREIYTRIKTGVKTADEADKILNQFSAQLDRSSGWFAKGCLRLTYSDDLRRDLVIKRKYGIQILLQDDRNHEFYVAMYALLQIKGVDKQVLDQIHQPGRATISQMSRIMEEVDQSALFRTFAFTQTSKKIEHLLQYKHSYTDIKKIFLKIKNFLNHRHDQNKQTSPVELNNSKVQECPVSRNEFLTKHYKALQTKDSIQSLALHSLNKDTRAKEFMYDQVELIYNNISALAASYHNLCEDISNEYSEDDVDIVELLEDQIKRAEAMESELDKINVQIIKLLEPYQACVQEMQ